MKPRRGEGPVYISSLKIRYHNNEKARDAVGEKVDGPEGVGGNELRWALVTLALFLTLAAAANS